MGDLPHTTLSLVGDGGARLRVRKIRVEIAAGPDAGRAVELPGPEVSIGTDERCTLKLGDAHVSRHHLDLRVDDVGLRVIDAGSHNGTKLDGVRIADAWARADSSIVIGGTTLTLRLVDDYVEVPLSTRERVGSLIGRSVPMRRLFALIERVGPTDSTVLVEGETGAGKELVAEAIHEESQRASGPFVVVDCSAISANLIESELFGHVRGAFTGAVGDREGAFEQADGGTLFLDEIGELPLELQPKLLRALERREVRRVGGNQPRTVDVRIVAATNRQLAAEVERGAFREDLFYRLDVVRLRVPPLRERADDIPLLAEHFARQLRKQVPPGEPTLPRALVRQLQQQAFPGNVRELRNAVTRALSIGAPTSDGAATAEDPATLPAIDLALPLKATLDRLKDRVETAYLRAALEKTGGNVSRAAELAGVNRKYIQRALKRLDLRDD
jgi:transcriptional regulator with GAF, ATPase, and Fis domain